QHAERATAAHRLRRPGRPAAPAVPRAGRVRTSQHAVNTQGGRH
ncbi:GntR family transcriptional regulator, partial [Streptomyces sp. SID11233]|nr:GntR family transcriptional regulator [Streptomyces sp. SID11233]